jgi:hypothetical protein
MTWEEVTVPGVRAGEPVTSHVRFAAGDVCMVEVKVSDDLDVRGEGPDLFEALASVRRDLEIYGVVLACNGSRRDVFPSPMLRQASAGRFAYELTIPRSVARPAAVDIFAPAPESAVLASVDDQRAWFDRWRESGIGGGRIAVTDRRDLLPALIAEAKTWTRSSGQPMVKPM